MNYSQWTDNTRTAKSGYSAHKIVNAKPWTYMEHGHRDFHELVCAVEGSFQNIVNGRELTQSAGEIILIRDRDYHALAGQSFTYVNIMFQTDWIGRLEHYTQFMGTTSSLMASPAPPRALIPPGQRAQYGSDLEDLLANAGSLAGRRLFAAFLLGMVIQHLAPPADREYPPGMPEWLRQVVAWIDERRRTPPSLADAVAHSGRCHEHFTREFTRHLGLAPSTYLTHLRIDRAAEMLITSNNKIADICLQTGFENESYFYRVFSRLKQMTPQAYRQAFGPRSIQRS